MTSELTPKYILPYWYGKKFRYTMILDEDIVRWTSEMNECIQRNQALYQSALASHNDIIARAVALYGSSSSICKTLKGFKIARPPDFNEKWKALCGRVNASRAEVARLLADEQAKKTRAAKSLQTRRQREQERRDNEAAREAYIADLPYSE